VGKFLVLVIFTGVFAAHLLILQTYHDKKSYISKPKAKVHRITLSSVVLKKPVVIPTVEPIILPPDLEPEPIVLPPDIKPQIEAKQIKKRKRDKHKKKKKKPIKKARKKPIVKQKPIIKKEVLEPIPIVEQVIAPPKMVDTSSLKDAYTSEIRRQIKLHLYYPKIAKRMRIQGVVRVSFLILADGNIKDISVLSGGKSILKKAAIKTIKSLHLKPLPALLGEHMRVSVPVGFNIKGL
jgi:protein TonB